MYIAVSLTSESSDHYCVLVRATVPEDFAAEVARSIGEELRWCYINDYQVIDEDHDTYSGSDMIKALRQLIEKAKYDEEE